MKTTLMRQTLTGAGLLAMASLVHAACVNPVGFPPNDVNLELPPEIASATTLSVEFDMNGVQRGLADQRPWATHGTMLVLFASPTAAPEWIASWTQNSFRLTTEWVCRMRPDSTGAIVGTGVYHVVDHATPTFAAGIDRCVLTFTDC